ncbi:MAG: hypothetical protein ACXWUZ_11770 [Allosphingosinicella sp.]
MRKSKFRTVAVIAVFSSLAVATPAQAASICDIDPNTNWYSWFAHEFGYCRGHMD